MDIKANTTNSEKLTSITEINKVPCKVIPYDDINTSLGIMYITEYNLKSENIFTEFEEYLIDNYNIIEVKKADYQATKIPTLVQ